MKMFLITCLVALAITARAADIKQRPQPPKQASPESVSMPTKAMVCSQCKTVAVVSQRNLGGKPGFPQPPTITMVHKCPGCRDTFVRKAGTKEMDLVHKCTAPGEPIGCCARS